MRDSQRDRNLIFLEATPLRGRRQVVKTNKKLSHRLARSEKLQRVEEILERSKPSNKFVLLAQREL